MVMSGCVLYKNEVRSLFVFLSVRNVIILNDFLNLYLSRKGFSLVQSLRKTPLNNEIQLAFEEPVKFWEWKLPS